MNHCNRTHSTSPPRQLDEFLAADITKESSIAIALVHHRLGRTSDRTSSLYKQFGNGEGSVGERKFLYTIKGHGLQVDRNFKVDIAGRTYCK